MGQQTALGGGGGRHLDAVGRRVSHALQPPPLCPGARLRLRELVHVLVKCHGAPHCHLAVLVEDSQAVVDGDVGPRAIETVRVQPPEVRTRGGGA